MNKALSITQESFEAFLGWLNPDRDIAGHKYELIRHRLVKLFVNKGCPDPEDLADSTINRVIAKVPQIRDSYVGDPFSYFCGVARNVFLESLRRKEISTDTFPSTYCVMPATDDLRECLDGCLRVLPTEQSELVLEYYLEDKKAKIDHRRQMAEDLGLTVNALRLKAFRVRSALEECVDRCITGQNEIDVTRNRIVN